MKHNTKAVKIMSYPTCAKCNWPIQKAEQFVIVDAVHVYHKNCAPVAQPAEAPDLKPVQ